MKTKSEKFDLENAEVVLHLEVSVAPENRTNFLAFCQRAFPVYESLGNNKMVLYEDTKDTCRFNEVGYYLTMEDYKRAETAIEEDTTQASLIREWHTLLSAPPVVKIYRKILE